MTRSQLTVVAVLALVVGSGCLGVPTGSEPLEFTASQPSVSDAALSQTGYQEQEVREEPLERTVTVAGQERTVKVTNWVSTYARQVSLGPLGEQELGVFVVLTTPEVEVLGRTFNPVGDMSNRELLAQIQGNYQGLQVGERVGSKQIQILGQGTTLETFSGTATVEGQQIDIRIRIARVTHEGDFVIAVGIYPTQLQGEAGRIETLMGAVSH
ncbi:MAG: DUF6517 family protein [Halobacteriales archaeon]|nr:DUF6517 family protein [Halobacteriales archaeon]